MFAESRWDHTYPAHPWSDGPLSGQLLWHGTLELTVELPGIVELRNGDVKVRTSDDLRNLLVKGDKVKPTRSLRDLHTGMVERFFASIRCGLMATSMASKMSKKTGSRYAILDHSLLGQG